MPTRAHDRFFEEQRERDRRYGLEHDEYAEFVHELELADRIADQASLPPGHPLARAAARHRLGRGPSPYEQPHEPEPQRLAAGERVTHHRPDGSSRPGRVVRAPDHQGLVEVDFGGRGSTLVAGDELEREAA
jgi:hypothetical protein